MKITFKKLLNPLIWLINILNYFAHLEGHRWTKEYMAYDFGKDLRYY